MIYYWSIHEKEGERGRLITRTKRVTDFDFPKLAFSTSFSSVIKQFYTIYWLSINGMWLVGVFDISISRKKKFQLMFWGQPKKIEAAMKYTILLICFIAYLNRGNNVNKKIYILLKYNIQNTLRNLQFFNVISCR